MLIFDEVQTGLGRVGERTAMKTWGVRPQLQTFAKALGSGIPAGAVLVTPEIARKVRPGALGSTFGGGPLACAAISATLKGITDGKLWENAAVMEIVIRETFKFPQIREIRGRGLLLGLVLDGSSKPVRDALLDRRIIVGGADDPNVIRLLPPLIVGPTEIAVLRGALTEIFGVAPTTVAVN
jgi:acetylornithine/succinyldiaminopimelate/putrescine aminotransferase